jgi:NADH dehydrogenase
VRTTPTLAVPDQRGVWAAGDCAAVYDATTGERHPATAQHAVRAARALADNVHASVRGESPVPFSYASQGSLCVVGHQVACAELRGRQFSGRVAWALWRGVYLAKLPGVERRARVLLDWTVELFFPRDTVQVVDEAAPAADRIDAADREVVSRGR